MRDLDATIREYNRIWAQASDADKQLIRQRFIDAGWNTCGHDCTPWNCEVTNPMNTTTEGRNI